MFFPLLAHIQAVRNFNIQSSFGSICVAKRPIWWRKEAIIRANCNYLWKLSTGILGYADQARKRGWQGGSPPKADPQSALSELKVCLRGSGRYYAKNP